MWLLTAVTLLAVLRVLAYLHVVDVWGVSSLSWWWIGAGYALCAAWFAYADHSGLTSRKTMQRMQQARQARIARQRELLGLHRRRR